MSRSRDAQPAEGVNIESLFLEYYPRLYAYMRYRTGDVAQAEDLTSEVLERVLRYLPSYDPRKGDFAPWLFRIAHNTWVNHYKRQRRRGAYHVDIGERLNDVASPDLGPEPSAERSEEIARMVACVRTLPARQQEILGMRFVARLTNREIARALRMNERTVSVTILRALRKLRKQLEDPV